LLREENDIATLVDGESSTGGEGSYAVKFYGTGLPSSIYFYQPSEGNIVETKKMILLK